MLTLSGKDLNLQHEDSYYLTVHFIFILILYAFFTLFWLHNKITTNSNSIKSFNQQNLFWSLSLLFLLFQKKLSHNAQGWHCLLSIVWLLCIYCTPVLNNDYLWSLPLFDVCNFNCALKKLGIYMYPCLILWYI